MLLLQFFRSRAFVCVPLTESEITERNLYNVLKRVVSPEILGVQLGLAYYEVMQLIKEKPGDTKRQILDICARWMEKAENPTWEAVITALKDEDEYSDIVRNIKKDHLQVSCKLS